MTAQQTGNLQAGAGRLKEAWEKLFRRWADTRDHWHDANARNFEEEQLQTIADELQQVLPVISQMSQILAAAERELSDRQR